MKDEKKVLIVGQGSISKSVLSRDEIIGSDPDIIVQEETYDLKTTSEDTLINDYTLGGALLNHYKDISFSKKSNFTPKKKKRKKRKKTHRRST